MLTNTYRKLPQLQSLVYFESAARHLNFTAAANELGTTQPAVSQRVRTMEDQLGVALFERLHRGVKLTVEGERLYDTVRDSLDALNAATLRTTRREQTATLTIATDFGFAKLWLMPRMHALRRVLGDVRLRLLTTQEEQERHGDEVDFSIVFDTAPAHRCARLLLPERVVPVCNPTWLPNGRPLTDPRALQELPLLHLQTGQSDQRWMNWGDWFAAHGLRQAHAGHDAVLTFNDYSLVVQAAAAGHGVALGWAPLVDEMIQRGELALAFDPPVQTARGYFLAWPPARPLSHTAAALSDWIVEECSGLHARPVGAVVADRVDVALSAG